MTKVSKFRKKTHHKIFLLDDDPLFAKQFEFYLNENISKRYLKSNLKKKQNEHTFEYKIFNQPDGKFLKAIETEKPDLLFLDYHLYNSKGKRVLGKDVQKKVLQIFPDVEIIIVSSEDQLEIAVEMMKNGSFDYILKNESCFENVIKSIRNFLYIQNSKFEIAKQGFFLKVMVVAWIGLIVAGFAFYVVANLMGKI